MRCSPLSIVKFVAAITLPGAMIACGGGGGNSKTTSTLTVAPTVISLVTGETLQLGVTANNSKGVAIFPTITYSSSNAKLATVSTNGNICAGTWDASFIVCTPTDPASLSNAAAVTITATADGVNATTAVSVHPRIGKIVVNPPAGLAACISQGVATGAFSMQAFTPLPGNVDVTASVGTPIFSISDSTVGTIDSATGIVTAKNPGAATVSVTITGLVSPVTSLPAIFATCPPTSIRLHTDDPTITAFTANPADTKQLTADVLDKNGTALTGLTLTYSSSQSAAAIVSATGLVTASNAGLATFVASCTPPTCNPGLSGNHPELAGVGTGQAVYSNVAVGTITGTSASTAYAASTAATGLIPIDTTTNTAGVIITLPQIPTSFLWNRQGTKGYLGSSAGLMVFDPATNAAAIPLSGDPGNALAVSPSGSKVIVASPTQLFVYDTAGNFIETFPFAGAIAADFAADSSKAFIVSSVGPPPNTIYALGIYAPSATFVKGPLAPSTDIAFLAQGAAGYVAGDFIQGFATCNNLPLGFPTAVSASLIRALPDGTRLIAAGQTWLDFAYTATTLACQPAFTIAPSASLPALGGLDKSSLQLAPNGSLALITYKGGTDPAAATTMGIPFYNTTTNTAGTIPLNGGGPAFTGGFTLDSQTLYVGSTDSNVHVINTTSQADAPILVTLLKADGTTKATPDLITVRPK